MGFIYKIVNLKTNKMYVGKTNEKCPYKRWKRHQQTIANGQGCPALRDAVKKHGIENFKFEVIIICFDDASSLLEKEYIKKLNTVVPNGYNITEGGEGGGFIGKKHSDTTKQLIKRRTTEYFKNQEKRKDTANRVKTYYEQDGARELASYRTINSDKWKKAKIEGRIGTNKSPPTEETKAKIRAGLIRYYEKRKLSSKPV